VYQAHKAEGLLVVGIATSEDLEAIKKVVAEKQITFPILVADEGVQKSFGGQGSPETFMVSRSGAMIEHVKGAKGKEFFEERAKQLLAAK